MTVKLSAIWRSFASRTAQPTSPAGAWRLTADEIAEINRTGCIYLTVMSGRMLFPNFVGGERETRALIADTGQLWIRDHA